MLKHTGPTAAAAAAAAATATAIASATVSATASGSVAATATLTGTIPGGTAAAGGGGSSGGVGIGIGGGGGGVANLRNNNLTGRSIHLRPQQPLNISTLSASTATSLTTTTIANGGQRIPTTLLNIAPVAAAAAATTATTTTAAAATGTINTGPTLANGIGPPTATHLHTYSNQHVGNTNHSGHIHAHTHTHNHNNNNNHGHNNTTTTNNNNNNNNNTTITATSNNNNNNNYSNCTNFGGMTSLLSHNNNNNNNINNNNNNNYQQQQQQHHGPGPREALTSLGLLCLVSLLLALLSLIFLLKISPNGRDDALARNSAEDFVIVYDVTLALCALSLSLNLCCLLVCAIQFLFAVKLVRSPMFDGRDNKYLEKSSTSRTCAVGGFFISIPIFLTGIILYTFNHFHSTPAIITSVLIGIGIVFCGGAMVHNVFIWQKEKTISYRSPPIMSPIASLLTPIGPITPPMQFLNGYNSSPLPAQQQQLLYHPTSVTPVSPNHSHGSFNPLASTAINSSFIMRPATATPPTPKPANGCITLNGREASGSVSPGIPPTLDMSNITSTSLHELSTLV